MDIVTLSTENWLLGSYCYRLFTTCNNRTPGGNHPLGTKGDKICPFCAEIFLCFGNVRLLLQYIIHTLLGTVTNFATCVHLSIVINKC